MIINPKALRDQFKKFYPSKDSTCSIDVEFKDFGKKFTMEYWLHIRIGEDEGCEINKICECFESYAEMEAYIQWLINKRSVFSPDPDGIEVDA